MTVLSRLVGIAARPLTVRAPKGQLAEAIAVLGVPTRGGQISGAGRERVEAAVELYQGECGARLYISGRGEAGPMADYAARLGVPRSAIVIEDEAVSTADNARLLAKLMTADGHDRAWVVSQPFHLRRACLLFRRRGIEPLPFARAGGLQQRRPDLAARWVAREYASWVKLGLYRRR